MNRRHVLYTFLTAVAPTKAVETAQEELRQELKERRKFMRAQALKGLGKTKAELEPPPLIKRML